MRGHMRYEVGPINCLEEGRRPMTLPEITELIERVEALQEEVMKSLGKYPHIDTAELVELLQILYRSSKSIEELIEMMRKYIQ